MQVKMFGALRKFSDDDGFFKFEFSADATVAPVMTVSKFKTALSAQLEKKYADFTKELLLQSAIANQEEILQDDHLIQPNEVIAVLPPVCGG